MENNLPQGWGNPFLGEVVNITSGNSSLTKKIYKEDGKYVAFSGTGADGKVDFFEHEGNAIILSAVGARCGKCFKASGQWTTIANTSIIRTFLDDSKHIDFLFYLLNNENFWPKGGSGQPFVQSGKAQKETQVPLPPLPEQHRIVAKLDAVMQRVASNKQRLNKIPKLLKRFRQSVLTAAVRGELTENWRKKNEEDESAIDFIKRIKTVKTETEYLKSEISENWVSVRIGEVFEIVRGSSPRPKSDERYFAKERTDFHWIMLSDFTDNTKNDVLHNTNEFLTKEGIKHSRFVNQNDILVGVSGVYGVGRTCLLEIEGYIYDGIMAIKGVSEISFRKFIHYYLLLQRMKFLDVATGTSWPNINTSILKEYVFPIPPLNEQIEIVKRVEQLFDFADKLEARYTKAKTMIDKLPQSILAKAFRGELIPQNPDDEPASVLLKRIKIEKAKLNGVRKVKRSETVM